MPGGMANRQLKHLLQVYCRAHPAINTDRRNERNQGVSGVFWCWNELLHLLQGIVLYKIAASVMARHTKSYFQLYGLAVGIPIC